MRRVQSVFQRTVKTIPAALIFFLLLGGCGYHHQGYGPKAGATPIRVRVNIWDNKAREFGLEGFFNQAIINWLQESRIIKVVFADESADYTIAGSIDRIEFSGSAFDSHDTPTAIKAIMDTSWQIRRNRDNRIVWKKHERREGGYNGDSEAAMIRSNRRQALKAMAAEVAEQIYVQLNHLISTPLNP